MTGATDANKSEDAQYGRFDWTTLVQSALAQSALHIRWRSGIGDEDPGFANSQRGAPAAKPASMMPSAATTVALRNLSAPPAVSAACLFRQLTCPFYS